tara:strand:+ start:266 stop:808 length:543 start_codon:yes stop_codon:yes gene_type:complete
MRHIHFFIILISSLNIFGELPEMILGKEKIGPGINLVFEGAIKDDVFPAYKFGSEEDSDIHLEVLANWNEGAPSGSPEGGFVAYLRITAVITNQGSLQTNSIELLPHLNMSDNLHYALNTKLPGKRSDIYTIKFIVSPPRSSDLGLHYDWREEVGSYLTKSHEFEYKNLDFSKVANSTRR